MGTADITAEEKIKRFFYTRTTIGAYLTGNSDKHLCKHNSLNVFTWIKENPEDFLILLNTANEDELLPHRATLFYIIAEILQSPLFLEGFKTEAKRCVWKFLKNDDEFFIFVKYYTLLGPKRKQKVTTTLRKMILKFYGQKQPLDLANMVTKQDRHHGWSHKDLFKLTHFKCENIACEGILKFVLFGPKDLLEDVDGDKTIIELLKKSHELRTTTDSKRAVALVRVLNADVSQVNSKFNKNEEVWLAVLPRMSPREILQSLHRFHKFGFLKPGNLFQGKIIEILSNEEAIKECKLHPIEVFIHLKFFEKGGKTMDPKLVEYLTKKEIKEETLKKLQTPVLPKCKLIMQKINTCLQLSYKFCQPVGKKFLITIDTTSRVEEACYHSKRVTYFEGVMTIVRFLSKVEHNITVAIFKDEHINVVDISKSHNAIEKLQEFKANFINPSAPLDWAKNKKKNYDVFLNFMSSTWSSGVPTELREKFKKLPRALEEYQQKMKAPNARVVKMFLGGPAAAYTENTRNILSIAGFSVEVPRILEAFCRGNFC